MSISENPKIVSKNDSFFGICDHNALNNRTNEFQFVTIIFYYFCGKKVKNKF